MHTIQPAELASDRPYGEWSCRGRDIWDAFCAADKDDAGALRDVLARDPNLYRAEYWYTPPIHFAVRAGRIETTQVLLEAGADPAWRAMSGDDLATLARERGHDTLARLLEHESRRRQGVPKPKQPADDPIVAAARSGDLEQVRTRLAAEQDPTPDAEISRGLALHAAARAGNRPLVELLLDHGADPNFTIDSSGSATWAASTPELRQLLLDRGGRLDCYDLVFLDEDDEAVRRVKADPREADTGCGGVLAAACTLGKRELVVRLIVAGARVPRILTGCRGYLMSEPDTLRLLLERADLDPSLPNWQRATPLHDLCSRDYRGRTNPHRVECAKILLDAGTRLTERDEDYRSTPLAWAARYDLPDMVELLLERGSPLALDDDEDWATPLAWATKRGHTAIAERLKQAGATA
jgi:ankyrin repeat protein